MNWSPSLDEPVGGDDVCVTTPVADPSSMGGTLTLTGGTLALNGKTAIGALTQMGGTLSGAGTAGRATFALPFASLQSCRKRISKQIPSTGEPPCR